jgi:hypothetical protein
MPMPAKTPEMYNHLCKCAKDMHTVTYQDLAHAVGLFQAGMGPQLAHIRDECCLKQGLPWLGAIVVHVGNMRPDANYLPPGVTVADANIERVWRGAVLQVYAFDWDVVTPPWQAKSEAST